jgi:hypothetical protein
MLAANPLAWAKSSGSHHSGGHSTSSSSHSGGHSSSGSHSSGSHSSSSHSHATHSGYGHAKATGVARNSHGKIARSPQAKEAFRKSHPCPATGKTYGACRGYVIDHVQALKHGGADDPSNMQWQTTAQAKAKDKWE